jgi:hypothetical protein
MTGKLRSNFRCFRFFVFAMGIASVGVRQRARRAKNGNLSSGIIATKKLLRVTNVIAHGPGIKLLDGLAEASTNGKTTYAYRCRPRFFNTRHGLDWTGL